MKKKDVNEKTPFKMEILLRDRPIKFHKIIVDLSSLTHPKKWRFLKKSSAKKDHNRKKPFNWVAKHKHNNQLLHKQIDERKCRLTEKC